MAGHSHSSNIWGTKSAQDSKRSKLFTRISKDIENAVKIGKSSDPALNSLLRSALDKAKAVNIPQDKIKRAIDRGSGKSDEKDLSLSKIYEVLGKNNHFILVEAETDNPTRTYAEVKLIVSRSDFKMLEPGSAIRFFDEVGEVIIKIKTGKEDDLVDKIVSTSGIIDYQSKNEKEIHLYIEKESFHEILTQISGWGEVQVISAKMIYKSNLSSEKDEHLFEEMENFKNKVSELADVIEVWY